MPRPVERLERTLAGAPKEQGLAQERLRRWVSFLALCGVLERAVAKATGDELPFLANCNLFRPSDPEAKGIRPMNTDFRPS